MYSVGTCDIVTVKEGADYMNRVIGVFMLVIAGCASIYLVYMTRYFLGFRKRNLIHVTGYLGNTETLKKVFHGHPFSGKWHKYWTNYEYVYRINGQQYSIRGGMSGQKKDLPQSVTIAAQKNAPKNAIIPQLEKVPTKWILCFLMLGCAVFYTTGLYLFSH